MVLLTLDYQEVQQDRLVRLNLEVLADQHFLRVRLLLLVRVVRMVRPVRKVREDQRDPQDQKVRELRSIRRCPPVLDCQLFLVVPQFLDHPDHHLLLFVLQVL